MESEGALDALEVDGVIIVEPTVNDPVLEYFDDRNIPIVSIGRVPDRDDITFVDLQSERTAKLLLDHLATEGGRTGLITGTARRNSYYETERAYLQYVARHGYQPVAIRLEESGGEQAAREAVDILLRDTPDLTALCVPVDAFASGALIAAKAVGRGAG